MIHHSTGTRSLGEFQQIHTPEFPREPGLVGSVDSVACGVDLAAGWAHGSGTRSRESGTEHSWESAASSFAGGSRHVVWVLLAGLSLRLALAGVSLGSDDIQLWRGFAAVVADGGLLGRYGEIRVAGFPLNHPPLAVGFAVAVRTLARATGLPFAFLFKLPMIAADVVLAALLGRLASRDGRDERAALRVTAAYALSPLAIAISAYHGNTDSLCAALALAAAALLARGRPAASGLALGAALNVKLVPILLAPALLLQCPDLRSARRFVLTLGGALLPFAPFVAVQPAGFYGATLGYGSEWNLWGPAALIYAAQRILSSRLVPVVSAYVGHGTGALLGAVGLVSLAGRLLPRWNPIELCGACFGLLLAIAPGFGLQYLIYALPFVLLSSFRSGLAYSALAGLFAGVVYATAWTGSFPLYSHFADRGFPAPAVAIGLLAWAVLVAWLAALLGRGVRTGPASAGAD